MTAKENCDNCGEPKRKHIKANRVNIYYCNGGGMYRQNDAESLPAPPVADDPFACSFTATGEHAPSPMGDCLYCGSKGRPHELRPQPVAPLPAVEGKEKLDAICDECGYPFHTHPNRMCDVFADPKPAPSLAQNYLSEATDAMGKLVDLLENEGYLEGSEVENLSSSVHIRLLLLSSQPRPDSSPISSEPSEDQEWESPIDGEFEVIVGGLRRSVVPIEVHKATLAANREKDAEIEVLEGKLASTEYSGYSSRIKFLEAELASLRAAVGGEKWIDVKQDLPPFERSGADKIRGTLGKEYLIHPRADGSHTAFYGTRASSEPNFYIHGSVVKVTHWQPLPAPPSLPNEKE